LVNNQSDLSLVFAALADPTRRSIIEALSRCKEVRVTTLAKPFHMSLPAISRHLRLLEEARLIERRCEGRLHLISARPDGLKAAQEWLASYVAGWESSFDALDGLLDKEKQGRKNNEV
jgi:DNA-binding transcriptional ArsR family regulator